MLGSHSHGPFLTVSPVIQPALTCLFSYLSEPADAHTEGSLALGFSLSPLLPANPSTTLTAPNLLCNGGVTPNYLCMPLMCGVPTSAARPLRKPDECLSQAT